MTLKPLHRRLHPPLQRGSARLALGKPATWRPGAPRLLQAVARAVSYLLIRRHWRPDLVRRLWLAIDVMLTGVLILDEAFLNPLVFNYAVLVVASGLWLRAGLVWFTTAVAAAGYSALIAVGAARGALGGVPEAVGGCSGCRLEPAADPRECFCLQLSCVRADVTLAKAERFRRRHV